MKNLFLSVLMLMVFSICTLSAKAEILTVVSNSSSGINEANCVGILSDSTVLGFFLNYDQWDGGIHFFSNYVCFCGAISSSNLIAIPDSISFGEKQFTVVSCGSERNRNLDFEEAASVSSLTLPSTISTIYSVPSSVYDLHLKSTTPPELWSSSAISSSTTTWVPQSAFALYQNNVANSNSRWYGKVVRYEGWEPNSVTVTVNSPGTFAQVLLSQVEQWADVDELTVIGKINDTDLGYLARLKNVTKIDLSQTDIKSIVGCAGLSFLKIIVLPSTVVDVQSKAFVGCASLKEISIPNAVSIGEGAFSNCSGLTNVSLPAATNISDRAFSSCGSLTSVSLPAAVSIGEDAFLNCSLTSVSLPAATYIGSGAFERCHSLTSVSLPAATNIGSGAFERCNSLTSVSLPATLVYLGGDAFYECSRLEDVYCYVVSPLNTTAFGSTGASATTLHVPAISVSAYMLHDNWYTFNKIVALEGNVEKVNIISDFTITELKGLADKVDLSVLSDYYGYNYAGHLTVSASGKWSIGNYVQSQANQYSSSWNSDYTQQTYTYSCSTIIPHNEMSADSVTVKYSAQTDRWNFISFPFDVNVSDIQYPEGTLWVIRKYSGEDRAKMTGNTWQNMTDGMILKAGEGYILHCTDGGGASYVEFTFKAEDNVNKNNIFVYQDVSKPLSKYASDFAHNRNWNLIGNPYPCFYDTRSIEHNGVITVWNGYGYTAYSLLDDEYVLRPHESFFVQCPADATSMTFKADGRQHTSGTISSPSYTKATRAAGTNPRQVVNITLTGTEYTDRARVVINESAKLEYEISCDASKFMSSNTAVPQIYIVENGQKMAIDERPLSDGIITLGVYIGEAGEYTISASSAKTDAVILTDRATGKTTDLSSETYSFSALQGTIDNRFTIQFGTVAGIDGTSAGEIEESGIYSISGQRLSAPQNGINIINGNKILVK